MPLLVVLADDHLVVRQGLRALLEPEGIQIVVEAADGWEAIRLTEAQRPDVTILDLSMPGCNGIAATQAILQNCPGAFTIILTMHMEEHRVLSALRAGTRWAGAEVAFATGPHPGIADAAAQLSANGADRLVIAPWFLAHGRITDRVANFAAAQGISMAEPLGSHNLVAATVLDRFDAVAAARTAA